jgi:hypothetical protein
MDAPASSLRRLYQLASDDVDRPRAALLAPAPVMHAATALLLLALVLLAFTPLAAAKECRSRPSAAAGVDGRLDAAAANCTLGAGNAATPAPPAAALPAILVL